MSDLMSAKTNEKSNKPVPVVVAATAVPWNGVDAQLAPGSNGVISAVANPIAVANGATVAVPASQQELSYEVLSCRPMGPGQAQTGPANLIESGADINEEMMKEIHIRAKEAARLEDANIRRGNQMTASELRELEQLEIARLDARERAKEEQRNIKFGNQSTVASRAEGEKTLLRVQVPLDATPGMLLSVDMPGAKKGDTLAQVTFPLPASAVPGGVIELVVGVQDPEEAAVLAKMAKLREAAEERVRKEAAQEEYSYKGLGDGEYEYKPEETPKQEEEEYTYGG